MEYDCGVSLEPPCRHGACSDVNFQTRPDALVLGRGFTGTRISWSRILCRSVVFGSGGRERFLIPRGEHAAAKIHDFRPPKHYCRGRWSQRHISIALRTVVLVGNLVTGSTLVRTAIKGCCIWLEGILGLPVYQ
jgi:hypothetical protein